MEELIENAVFRLIDTAVTMLPQDVVTALQKAEKNETEDLSKVQLGLILENIALAKEKKSPICQDTGTPTFRIKLPEGVSGIEVANGVIAGVKKATLEVPLRPSIVHPLTRKNTGDNTGLKVPLIDWEPVATENVLEIDFMAKGGGSENKTVESIITNCAVDADRNSTTGSPDDVGAEALLSFHSGFYGGFLWFGGLRREVYCHVNLTGIEESEEERWGKHADGRVIRRGLEKDYVIIEFFISDLGLQDGTQVNVHFWAETESNQWLNFSFDEARPFL